jgi:hypothetical protein
MGQLRVPSEVSECLADGDDRLIVGRWQGAKFAMGWESWVDSLGTLTRNDSGRIAMLPCLSKARTLDT